ncbi:chitooligosaccharidolytic beta-N-acetylglucosaminidase-like [Euwallacea fornicatus]|uniref:chitooligosaccharidolytic beta-N-acetylglucosaminidase-like n=1 Tax=Euwallacea fornicatus TaxID=995702 RepID=UPI00338FA1A2
MMQKGRSILAFVFLVFSNLQFTFSNSSKWHYECSQGYCTKTRTTSNTTSPLSLAECNVLCLDAAGVWPKPTGNITIGSLIPIDVSTFSFTTAQDTPITTLVQSAFEIFIEEVNRFLPCRTAFLRKSGNETNVNVQFNIADQEVERLTFGVSESYQVASVFRAEENTLILNISADTFFGARHALETVAQLVVFDDLRNRTLLPNLISVVDGPVYSWRGLVLDTSRNYITPKAIERTLTAMAASKLNTFHWHITDTASFPYVSKTHPEMSENGAYTSAKVYTDVMIKNIVEYARVRGIRVVPELDSPAHVGEGWQDTGVVTCFNWKPWSDYCKEPPCGQFDPSKPELYDILEDLYGDILEQFGNEIFHMGGDEVDLNCWNHTESLTKWMVDQGWGFTSEDFHMKVWAYFQAEASKRLYNKAGKELPIILWTSDLTSQENVTDILPPSKYILQVWTTSNDSTIQTLLSKNYSVILSNYDVLYLDCGFGGWVGSDNNWCSPYKGWQLIYDNKPIDIVGDKKNQVLGGETALWTEESGINSLDSRLWPRTAAFAETLWTEPKTGWEEAEERMLIHRDRLVRLGLKADEMKPEWCQRNPRSCTNIKKLNGNFRFR